MISKRLGLYFVPKRWPEMQRGLASACLESGEDDLVSYVQGLLSKPFDRRQAQSLAGHLTIGETYFFRDEPAFKALKDDILPQILNERASRDRRIRIWSAGSATGEEPYSPSRVVKKGSKT